MTLRCQLRNSLGSVFWPQDHILFSRLWTVPSGLVPRVSCLIASSLSIIINFFCSPCWGLLFFYSSCLLQASCCRLSNQTHVTVRPPLSPHLQRGFPPLRQGGNVRCLTGTVQGETVSFKQIQAVTAFWGNTIPASGFSLGLLNHTAVYPQSLQPGPDAGTVYTVYTPSGGGGQRGEDKWDSTCLSSLVLSLWNAALRRASVLHLDSRGKSPIGKKQWLSSM